MRPAKKGDGRKAPAPRRVVHHDRLYGDIPLLLRPVTYADGTVREVWSYDPDYHPQMPPRAVRGDVRKQSFCPMCHVPRYFFIDEERTCVQCGHDFTFRAAEQKHWYETLRFHFDSVPIRCVTCRRQRRTVRALANQLAAARRDASASPQNPGHQLALARALVEHHQRTQAGNLNDAIAAARRARELWPEAAEPLFWEGMAQAAAGRSAKARAALEAFLTHHGFRVAGRKRAARTVLTAFAEGKQR